VHKPIHANNLPKPVGPYSPGMEFERLIFVSGQGAIDPATGTLAGATVEQQTEQCLKNVQAILEAGGYEQMRRSGRRLEHRRQGLRRR